MADKKCLPKQIDTELDWAGEFTGCLTVVSNKTPTTPGSQTTVVQTPDLITIVSLGKGAYQVTVTGSSGVALAFVLATGARVLEISASDPLQQPAVAVLVATRTKQGAVRAFQADAVSTGTANAVVFGQYKRVTICPSS